MARRTPQQELEHQMQKMKNMGVTISVSPALGIPRPEFDVAATIAAAAKSAGIYEESSN
ncbi:hypothetical protein [Cryobacterium sp. Hh11]|uniref:hypothetical protein n=1 Tax=Cryobacterium sp. Hh11 TaxID=2555868 RepID=UPI00141B4167|nr:hypothetical protein [Cryobacterium sp. Hh11]